MRGPLVLLAGLAVAAGPADPTPRQLVEAFERQVKAVHDAAGPALACVVVSRSDQYPKPAAPPDYPGRLGGFDPEAFKAGGPDPAALARRLDLADPRGVSDHESAAGVVIDPAGLVLTPFHVVEGATKIYVHLPGGRGSYADVHAADGRADLAVLKLLAPPADLKAVKLADARLHPSPSGPPTVYPGKVVVVLDYRPAAGVAFGKAGGLPTTLTNIPFPPWNPNSPDTPQSVYRFAPLLEFEARSAPAVSGAAVLNLDGELVGLTSAAAAVSGGDAGRAYALPLDANLRRVVDTLARGEEVEYGFLGILLNQRVVGVVVDQVSPRSPAEGRLSTGDTITRINSQPTRTFPDLLYQVGCVQAGNRLTLAVRGADGKERPVELTVAKFRHDGPFIAANRPAPVLGLRVDWGSVLSQGGAGAPAVPPGVAVRDLLPGSPAAAKFKDLGENARWVVTQVNGTPCPTPAAFYAAARNQQSVRLTLVNVADRADRPRDVTLP